MANDSKRGVFSSLFGRNKRDKEAEEAAELEAKQRLELRIEQALAGFSVPEVEEMSVAIETERNAA
jgi:hypothetical protein